MAKKQTPEKAAGTVVYCGPTIPGVAKQYTIYTNGIPAPLSAAVAKYPPMGGLLIPLDQLPDAMKKLNGKCGHIHRLFRLVQAKL